MKALKNTLVLLLILVVAFAIYVGSRPADFNFERSRTIQAPVSVLFNKVNDFKNWPAFSPWIEQDTAAQIRFGEVSRGVGGEYEWEGEILGVGNMRTDAAVKDQSISQTINFLKPYEATSNVNWRFRPVENGTEVTWQMDGEKNFLSKLYTVFMGSIEEMTGPDFERGLYKLDSVVQQDMKVYSIEVNGVVEHSGGYYLYKSTSCKMSEFETEMKKAMPAIGGCDINQNTGFQGRPFVFYQQRGTAENAVVFSPPLPTTTRIHSIEPGFFTRRPAPFRAAKTTLTGD